MHNVLVLLFHVVVSAVNVIISKFIVDASAGSKDLEIQLHVKINT